LCVQPAVVNRQRHSSRKRTEAEKKKKKSETSRCGINTRRGKKGEGGFKKKKQHPTGLEVLNGKVAGDGLPEVLDHLGVLHNKGVKVTRAADLELGDLAGLLDTDFRGVLSAEGGSEGFHVSELLGHLYSQKQKED